ncbi:MAG: hypothetical protein K2J10_03315 [Muribaculaceae bacterium]|nr:hypothetical protein [Muribaculaceae bacterium]
MLAEFIHGAILGLVVVAVNHFTSPQKKMTKTKRLLLVALVCIITGLVNLILPE